MQSRKQRSRLTRWFPISLRDLLITGIILLSAAEICILLQMADSVEGFASPVFVLAVLLISRLTTGYLYGLIAAVAGVVCVNFTIAGYPITFLTFLMVSVITSTLTTQARQQERLRSENEREKMRANLLRSVSHDIRTPLTSIVGSTSAVLENPGISREEEVQLLEDVRDEAQWLIRVVENLLSVTRIGDDQAHITKEPEAAEEVLAEAVRKFRKRFPATSVTVAVPDELLLVPMDPILIEQVLANVMENAVFHGGAGSIRVSVHTEEKEAVFSVWNDGARIAEKDLPNVFDGTLRHSAPAECDGKRSMGLGLSVSMAIVRAHGGTMEAQNQETGVEFSFRLPLNDKEDSV